MMARILSLVVLIALIAMMPVVAAGMDTGDGLPDSSGAGGGVEYWLLSPGFVPNVGQYDPGVAYVLQHQGTTVFFTGDGLVLSHTSGDAGDASMDVIRQTFVGASPEVNLMANGRCAGVVNYYIGDDPSKWLSDIPVYSGILYKDLYPGVDLLYTGADGRLKREFHVAPGADPSQIELLYEGESRPHVDGDGILRFASSAGEMLESPLVCWQVIDGVKIDRTAEYVVDGGSVRIAVGGYDAGYELIIDPELVYSSYLGGSGYDYGYGFADDGSGGVWVTGSTSSTDFPVVNAYQGSYGGNSDDAFISHFSSSGTLLSSTYLGGGGRDQGCALASDGAGGVWFMGRTTSTDFPVLNKYQEIPVGVWSTTVAHFSSTGALLSSSCLGGGDDLSWNSWFALVSDDAGGAWVTGRTNAIDLPTINASQSSNGGVGWDAFVAHFSPSGTILSSTYLGGDGWDYGIAVVGDGSGGVWVTGSTTSTDFPAVNAHQSSYGGNSDIFLAHYSSSGTLLSSTYLGGGEAESEYALVGDGSGGVWVTGETSSSDFPVLNAYQSNHGGGSSDIFLSRFSSSGTLLSSTYLGGGEDERGVALAGDGSGGVWVTGFTYSADFPVRNAHQSSREGLGDSYLAHFSSSGTLLSSTYLGGGGYEYGDALLNDGSSGVWVAGHTSSNDFPFLNASQGWYGGGVYDGFLSHFSSSGILLESTCLGGGGDDQMQALLGDGSGNVWAMGKTDSTDFPLRNAHQGNAGGNYDVFVAKFGSSIPVPPTAGFTANVTAGTAPLAVSFTDTSTGTLTSWEWSFGDGNLSTVQNPVHVYAVPGNYTVSLKVTNAGGDDTRTRVDYVSVAEPAGSLTVTSSPAGAAVWLDGADMSAMTNTTLTGISAGNHTVVLKLDGYQDATEQVIVVGNGDVAVHVDLTMGPMPPTASFTANVTAGTAPFAVSFTDTSSDNPVSWDWDLGDGAVSSEQNPIHTYLTAGTYTVILKVADAAGESGSVVKDGYIIVKIASPPNELKVSEEQFPLRSDAVNVSVGGGGQQQVAFNVTAGIGEIGEGNRTIHFQAGALNVTIETDGLTDDGEGVVRGVNLTSTAPVDATVETGNVSVSFAARMQNYDPDLEITTMIFSGLDESTRGAFALAAQGESLGLTRVAYTVYFAKSTPTDTIHDAVLEMAVPEAWVYGNGGPDAIRVFRMGDYGDIEVLVPSAHWLEGGMRVFRVESARGFSLFALGATTRSAAPVSPTSFGRSGGGKSSSAAAAELPISYAETGSLATDDSGVVTSSIVVTAGDAVASLALPAGVRTLDAAGEPLSEASIAPLAADQVPGVPAGAAFRFAGYAYEAGPGGATFDPAITLTLDIPDDAWNDLGAGANTLTVMWYDQTTGQWEPLPTSVDESARSVDAEITHFSTFALFVETAATPVPTATEEAPVTSSTPPAAEGFPTMPALAIVVVLIVVIAAGYFLMVRR
ncbi:MAG: PKD domain-containing protein [Methanoculleus sp.]